MKTKILAFIILFVLSTIANGQTKESSEKQQLLSLLQTSIDSFVAKVKDGPEQIFFKHPNDTAWSLVEITEHLSQIEEGYVREYFVAINGPPPSAKITLQKVTDAEMIAYKTKPEKGKAKGTNLPLGRYCTKESALKVLQQVRAETINVASNAKINLRDIYTYRKKDENVYEVKDIYQHFLSLIAHMKRHTKQAQGVLAVLK